MESPGLDFFSKLIVQADSIGASDLHLTSHQIPIFRLDGDLVIGAAGGLPSRPISHDQLQSILFDLLTPEQKFFFQKNKSLDFAIAIQNIRIRANLYEHLGGLALACRLIPSQIPTLEFLKTPEIFKNFMNQSKGLVLITGPTGSGKSTTLAGLVNYLNTQKSLHIVTIEDPIEFIHESQKSLIHQRELNTHTPRFDLALKAALREDPDVILVGELRDLETIRLALTAAETGHLVLGTLHTNSAAKSLDRLIDVFPGDERTLVRSMLSESLSAVISQRLIKKNKNKEENKEKSSGRVAAFEILVNTPAVSFLIRENKIPQIYSAIQTGQAHGMQTLDQALKKLVTAGEIDFELA